MRVGGLAIALFVLASSAASASSGLALLGSVPLPCANQELMEGVRDIALTPDDQHLYVPAIVDETLTVFDHDPVTGGLTFNRRYDASDPGVEGLTRVAFDPTGTHLYVTALTFDRLAVFARDAGTGALTLVETQVDGVSGVDRMRRPVEVVVSPDGAHVYVVSQTDESIVTFARDAGTGALTFVGFVEAGSGGVPGFFDPGDLAPSPDGLHLYVRSNFVGSLQIFARDPGTGVLTYVGSSGVQDVSSFDSIVSPDGAHVYMGSSGAVVVTARDAGTGALTLVETESGTPSSVKRSFTISPDGAHLYVGATVSEATLVEVYARDAGTGGLTFLGALAETPGGVDGLDGIGRAAVSADGSKVHFGGRLDSSIATFARDAGTGALTQTGLLFDPGEPRAAAVAPDGAHVYVACSRSTSVFARDAGTGAITLVETVKHSRIPGNDLVGGGVVRILVAPGGAHAYLLRRFAEVDQLEAFARDPGTGALTSVQAIDSEGPEGVEDLESANAIAIAPDGEHLYVAGSGDDPVVVYDRDPVTGLLTLAGAVPFASLGTWGFGFALSPDGAHAYFLGREPADNQEPFLTVLARDAGTGLLTVVQSTNQVPPIGSGGGPVAVSADGATVYAGGGDASAVMALTRDPGSGFVTSGDSVRQGVGGAQGLERVHRIVVDPADTHVFTTGSAPDEVGAFRRHDDGTGELTFTAGFADDADGADALGGLEDLAVSPDSKHLYAVARTDEAITIFGRVTGCSPTPAPGCVTAAKSRLTVKYVGLDTRRVLSWKWQAGMVPPLGDPLTTSDVALCVYDASAATQPLIDAVAPAGGTCGGRPCWRGAGAGVKYADKLRTPDGLQKLKLLPKPGGTSKIVVKAKGGAIPSFGLPLTVPVTLQLQTSDAGCIEAAFIAAGRNDGLKLVASVP